LQYILRHDELTSTDAYIEKLTFAEDMEAEYRLHMDSVARALNTEALPEVCRDCVNNRVCKYIEEILPYAEVVLACRFKRPKKEVTVRVAKKRIKKADFSTYSLEQLESAYEKAQQFNDSTSMQVIRFFTNQKLKEQGVELPVSAKYQCDSEDLARKKCPKIQWKAVSDGS